MDGSSPISEFEVVGSCSAAPKDMNTLERKIASIEA
jgi:hypothetical protein